MRAARALLRWSAQDLAQKAKLGRLTITRAESFDGVTTLTAANADAVRTVLEANGVEFIDENGGGAGVRFKQAVARPGAARD